ncbi:adenylate/guanylate cyclase domain-containing protein [Celeribacter sp.]|uniref:adenylate/guanylate cyclase domain-containing protein n=1 Tax=Celeribacter sp. TaxID=1890673 RepID=UPI003A909A10
MSGGKTRDWADLDSEGRCRQRFDFVSEVLSTDDATQTATIRLTPDPRRYEIEETAKGRLYIDKFTRVAIPEDVVQQMMQQHLGGLPVSYGPPSISSASDYSKSRRASLGQELNGEAYTPPEEKAHPQKELFSTSSADFVSFISVDIVGSTSLRQKFGKMFDRSYEVFLRELLTSVGHFRGAVLNVTGDGFIAFIDMPGFTSQCDNTVDLGLTLLRILREAINPALEAAGLPLLAVRVGADVGKARKRVIAVAATGFQSHDIGSEALNRAVKLQENAQTGQFLIGQALYELLHVGWVERCSPVPFDGEPLGAPGYSVYQIT